MVQNILFLINPISGIQRDKNISGLIEKNIDKAKYNLSIKYTEWAGHARELASNAVNQGIDSVVVVGGDGTMNEVAGELVNTPLKLGLIPTGSGNGLARHLGIPLDPLAAINTINNGQTIKIDAGSMNGQYFFCTAGIGFDAYIGKRFAESKTRGFSTYVKTTFKEFFNYKPKAYTLEFNTGTITLDAFLITFANAGQYGNNAYISPNADITDGLLDICILLPFPKYKAVPLGLRLFNKTMHKSSYLKLFQTNDIKVKLSRASEIHLDGEPGILSGELQIKTLQKCLKVIVP